MTRQCNRLFPLPAMLALGAVAVLADMMPVSAHREISESTIRGASSAAADAIGYPALCQLTLDDPAQPADYWLSGAGATLSTGRFDFYEGTSGSGSLHAEARAGTDPHEPSATARATFVNQHIVDTASGWKDYFRVKYVARGLAYGPGTQFARFVFDVSDTSGHTFLHRVYQVSQSWFHDPFYLSFGVGGHNRVVLTVSGEVEATSVPQYGGPQQSWAEVVYDYSFIPEPSGVLLILFGAFAGVMRHMAYRRM